jgi:hypothetical protein
MKSKNYIFRSVVLGFSLISLPIFNLFSQTEIIFDPSALIPHEDGYYISGVEVDENEDGIMEFHKGCEDYYENPLSPQDNHHETGTQQDFSYVNCMIMPTCEPKGTPIEPPVANGYIQMAPGLYLGTDSASMSTITTPPLSNIISMTMETSSDVSINDTRKIPYNIEYSKDFGTTWEETYIQDYVATQGGYRIIYNTEHSLEFDEMIQASNSSPILIRISTNDKSIERPLGGQYVKVHSIKILAEKASAIKTNFTDNNNLYINDRTVFSNEKMLIFNTNGQLVGSGQTVNVPVQGIYMVLFDNGNTQKIIIK